MSVIKYKVDFKRILTAQVREGKISTVRVGEVTRFQQNIDGTLDITAWIWPQTSQKMRQEIEKNPGIMGMTAETQLVAAPLVLPDSARFEKEKECDNEYTSLENDPTRGICRKCGYQP